MHRVSTKSIAAEGNGITVSGNSAGTYKISSINASGIKRNASANVSN
jgi:hypothetical protein